MNNKAAKLIVIMPCRDEADNLKFVVDKLRALKPLDIIVGLDPKTTDDTKAVAESLGCKVVVSNRSGYDPVVHAATKYALENYSGSLLFYTDAGDKYSYEQIPEMISLIREGSDMVMGVRKDAQKTMRWHQKAGTRLILTFINLAARQKLRDISPFRLVRSSVFDVVVNTADGVDRMATSGKLLNP